MSGSSPSKPLSGIRVFELGIAIAGPTCTRYLAFFGADVLKVESPKNPDVVRILGEMRTQAKLDALSAR